MGFDHSLDLGFDHGDDDVDNDVVLEEKYIRQWFSGGWAWCWTEDVNIFLGFFYFIYLVFF